MSHRGILRHSVHGSRGRLKAWLITFNFDRFRAPPHQVIFFDENLPMGCGTTYNASRLIRTIRIFPECHQTTHLWFCGAAKEWPLNSRKSCSYVCSKSWEFLIYHPMSSRATPQHSVHGSRGRLKSWPVAFNFAVLGLFRARLYFSAKTFLLGVTRVIMYPGCIVSLASVHGEASPSQFTKKKIVFLFIKR